MNQFKETYRSKVAERLMRYVQVDTCADPNSEYATFLNEAKRFEQNFG
jgi:hypothetical protein